MFTSFDFIQTYSLKAKESLVDAQGVGNATIPTGVKFATEGQVTFAQQFPNAHTADVMASYFGKSVSDVIDQNILETEYLYLSDNMLIDITGIDIFTNLQKLYLDSNQLASIPNSIDNLSNVQTLSLGYNQLTSIPQSIGF
ncbi:hypothetical protein AZF37_02680 [endosymbiont 'TC1' of Trimyema compressum]|uniref:leucine-rich repeat domain-containing protein n=1 Tax=endosymbiont 'TC1' of Trimyema compressum TaxID=243899 RepID=UPI0007F10E5B|nr:leucine-rich repeat domain-containing protein [endosymbiont 'TC1' of Trimyema compressum]AMP20223.1 hypothetical protein AZF37_02680 [endosymbiont 'TC1' of Trimyema compressum]